MQVAHSGSTFKQGIQEELMDSIISRRGPRRALGGALAGIATAVLGWSGGAALAAEDPAAFPSKPVRFVVAYAPGGVTDVSTRLLAETMARRTGRPFIVDNRAGAGGEIGAEYVARAEPDGYTIIMAAAGGIINPIFGPKQATQPRSYAWVAMVSSSLNFFITAPGSGYKDLKSLVEAARRAPGTLNFGSPGVGTFGHLVPLVFANTAGIRIEHVPYKGTGPALVDLMANRIALGQATISSIKEYVDSGRLVGLAVLAHKRAEQLPNVPTIVEAGYPQFIAKSTWEPWQVVAAPRATPAPLVERLNGLIGAALRDADLAQRFDKLGLNIYPPATPGETQRFVEKEFEAWLAMQPSLGVKID